MKFLLVYAVTFCNHVTGHLEVLSCSRGDGECFSCSRYDQVIIEVIVNGKFIAIPSATNSRTCLRCRADVGWGTHDISVSTGIMKAATQAHGESGGHGDREKLNFQHLQMPFLKAVYRQTHTNKHARAAQVNQMTFK